jgi:hypothetical protein
MDDNLREDIQQLKKDLSAANKECENIKSTLRQKQGQLERELKRAKQRDSIILRDIDLCKSYITKHPNSPSKNIVAFLNIELTGKFTRWPTLDSHTFMGCMGYILEDTEMFVATKEVIDGRQTHTWKIK